MYLYKYEMPDINLRTPPYTPTKIEDNRMILKNHQKFVFGWKILRKIRLIRRILIYYMLFMVYFCDFSGASITAAKLMGRCQENGSWHCQDLA